MDVSLIIATAITGLSSVTVALIGYWGVKQRDIARRVGKDLEHARHEITFRKQALELHVDLQKWSDTEAKIKSLLDNTEIDRFLILRCWNGELDPKWTTAIYQFRVGEQESFAYISVDLDADYVARLREMNSNGHHYIPVEGIPDSLIKRVYESEGVKHSIWFPIMSNKLESSSAASHTYCSFASHNEDPISPATTQRCQNLAWIIRESLQNQ